MFRMFYLGGIGNRWVMVQVTLESHHEHGDPFLVFFRCILRKTVVQLLQHCIPFHFRCLKVIISFFIFYG